MNVQSGATVSVTNSLVAEGSINVAANAALTVGQGTATAGTINVAAEGSLTVNSADFLMSAPQGAGLVTINVRFLILFKNLDQQ